MFVFIRHLSSNNVYCNVLKLAASVVAIPPQLLTEYFQYYQSQITSISNNTTDVQSQLIELFPTVVTTIMRVALQRVVNATQIQRDKKKEEKDDRALHDANLTILQESLFTLFKINIGQIVKRWISWITGDNNEEDENNKIILLRWIFGILEFLR